MKIRRGGLLVAGLLAACSQQAPLEQHVVLHPNKSIWKEWFIRRTPQGDTVLQGPFKEFYWNGSPAQVTQYQNGLKDGSAQAWYENGANKWTKFYHQGKPDGVWRLYTEDGRPRLEVTYANGAIQGTVKIWDQNDTTSVRSLTFQHGQCIGGDCSAFDSLQASPLTPTVADKNSEAARIRDFLE